MVRYKTLIAIPSYGRFQQSSKFCTARWISKVLWPSVRYYVEAEEVRQYRKMLEGTGAKIKTASRADVPKMWGSIMDLIVDECSSQCDHLVIMDDDLKLDVRPHLPSKPTVFEPMHQKTFADMISKLSRITTYKVPLCSAQYRQFCQGKKERYQHNGRISMIWSMNCKFFRDNPQFRFYRGSNLKFMSDYYFFLNLLVNGHPNLSVNEYTKDDKPNAPGGEQSKRSLTVFNEAVRQFAEMFPQYVSVRVKKDKGSWKDGMLGVVIRASQAFKDSQKKLATLG